MTIKPPPSVKQSNQKAEVAFIEGQTASSPAPMLADARDKTALNVRFNSALLARVDDAARKMCVTRTAWIHMALVKVLNEAENGR
jgi:hypothetical protein